MPVLRPAIERPRAEFMDSVFADFWAQPVLYALTLLLVAATIAMAIAAFKQASFFYGPSVAVFIERKPGFRFSTAGGTRSQSPAVVAVVQNFGRLPAFDVTVREIDPIPTRDAFNAEDAQELAEAKEWIDLFRREVSCLGPHQRLETHLHQINTQGPTREAFHARVKISYRTEPQSIRNPWSWFKRSRVMVLDARTPIWASNFSSTPTHQGT